MFTFNVSGSSSQGRSSQGSSKSNYVPSTYIAKQLALEEEARRKRELDGRHPDATRSSLQTEDSQHWPTKDEVLAPGYSSGPLGYDLPAQTLQTSRNSQQFLNDSVRSQEARPQFGAGVGQGFSEHGSTSKTYPDFFEKTTTPSLRSTPFTESAPDRSSFATATGATAASTSGTRSILRNDRPELNKEDIQKRNASVRFSAVAPELATPRPQSPSSVFNQTGGASPFFASTGHLSASSSMTNLHSALKENGKVDVLSHRGATGAPALNSSLGPALGSVSGAAQPLQTYSSPRMMQSELNTGSMRGNGMAGAGAAGSSFYMGLEGGATMRQAGKLPSAFGKNPRDEDEDDKDKERYMPAILLGTSSGLKGAKIEPFVDGTNGKTEWDSDRFQQSGPSRDGHSRLAPHLIGEDAPPADTLYDIAQKEKYYFQPTATLSQFSAPNPHTRSSSDAGHLLDPEVVASGEASSSAKTDDDYDSIITYGFSPEAASYVLNQFRSFGTIVRYETGTYGRVVSESFNWLKIQYKGSWAARNATSRHLQAVGKFIVGVHACRSFSTTRPMLSPNMAMDTTEDREQGLGQQSISRDLTEAEARDVEAGVDALLRMRVQGSGPDLSQGRASTSIRHASLYESWSQGAAGTPFQPQSSSSSGYSPTRTLNESTSGAAAGSGARSSMDQEDEDMAYILGHSLTSGGALARSSRGRAFEREKDEFLRSRSKDPHHPVEQDDKSLRSNGVDGGILSESQPVETGSLGFRPLFGQNESKGLYASSSGSGFGTNSQQQQQHSQSQPHSQFFDQRAMNQQGAQVGHQPSQHQHSFRRPTSTFGDSGSSDTTLFASSGGVLLDSSMNGSGSASPYHVQKKQRLSSSLFAPTGSPSSPTMTTSNVPLSQFGRGRDRSSLLVDDPALVDQWGAPFKAGASSGTVSGAAGVAGATAAAPAQESMISSVFNKAKKRLFWG